MIKVISLLLFPVIFASSLFSNEITYTAPNSPVLEQKAPLLTLTPNSQPERYSAPETPIVEATSTPIHLSSCVLHLKELIPDLPNLDAIDWPINTITPKVGNIIKFQYYNATTTKYTYHIAVITEITEETYKINEANYEKNKETNRTIQKNDEHILGFFDVSLWREIQKLPKEIQDTLKCESGFSHYDSKGAVLRGKDLEWGISQWKKESWKFMTNKRRNENIKPILLDILNPYDQLIMTKYAFEQGYQDWWTCYKNLDIIKDY